MPESTLKIEKLSLPVSAKLGTKLAYGIPFGKLQYLAQLAGDENAPHFLPANEPKSDNRIYQAVNKQKFYRPVLRVARRRSGSPGPEVRFLKDADGVVRLHFELEESPQDNLPQGAEPFNVKVEKVFLEWKDSTGQKRTRNFDKPSLVSTDDPDNPSQSNFSLRMGAQLNPEEEEPIYHALSRPESKAVLQVDFSFGYWLDEGASPPPAGGGAVISHPTLARVVVQPHLMRAAVTAAAAARRPTRPNRANGATSGGRRASTAREAPMRLAHPVFKIDRDAILAAAKKAKERERKPNFRVARFSRRLPFSFDENLEANQPIYRAILSKPTLTENWTSTEFGYIKDAGFPNTVYRLPDEIRLAFSPELGTPYMMPSLYRDEQEDVRVRVVLQAVPWHNPESLVKLRDFLYTSSGGALAASQIIVGGYESANLKFTGAFPDQIKLLDGQEISVSLESGFQVTLDLSLEFYRFLGTLLTGPIGLTGEVKVVIMETAVDDEENPVSLDKRIPVRLNFDDLAGLPVSVDITEGAISPENLKLTNPCPLEIRIDRCIPRLLQVDQNSVVPLEVFDAETATPEFPVTLASQADLEVSVKPKDEEEAGLWNVILVELIGGELTQDPVAVLDRIHEIAPQNTLAWRIKVECPSFTQPLGEKYKNLFRIQVKISRPGFAPQQVVLSPEKSSDQITMQRTLMEIVGEEAGAAPSFKYRVQNIYLDHAGSWGEEKDGEGDFIFAFPNPVEND